MTSRMRQFEHVTEIELPALYRDFALPPETRELLDRYARELRDWMPASCAGTWAATATTRRRCCATPPRAPGPARGRLLLRPHPGDVRRAPLGTAAGPA
ncbi:hypothetical protein GXW82_18465 [Streptacidiphilus sp. 4-A2]|nr:hypothetical protein [Streptacidiphilus sp. 4-A2]